MEFKRLNGLMIREWLANDVNELLFQLFPKARGKSRKDIKRIISQPEMVLIGAFDGEALVGMATIHFYETLIRKTGIVEDVVVLKQYRGKGIGKRLVKLLIKEAQERGAACVELTSNPKREKANAMYEGMGFEKRETNCYRLDLSV